MRCHLLVLACAASCNPAIPSNGGQDGGGGADAGSDPAPAVTVEPPSPMDAIPRVVRFHLQPAADVPAGSFRLMRGLLSARQAKQLSEPLPKSLQKRLVAATVWPAGDSELVMEPSAPLDPDGDYSVVGGALLLAVVHVADHDVVPLLSLVWPPQGRSRTGLVGVWCAETALPPIAAAVALEPAGVAGALKSGVAAGEAEPGLAGRRCVHFEPDSGASPTAEPLIPPLLIADDHGTPIARLPPDRLQRDDAPAVAPAPLDCDAALAQLGPGCGLVEDDRILLQPPAAALLWNVHGADGADPAILAASEAQPFYLWPLAPASKLALTVTTVDLGGTAKTVSASVVTQPPTAHVVVNEIFAAPRGPRPLQEWIELYNDGLEPAPLLGLRLARDAGDIDLPDATLPAGGFGLVVLNDYDPTGADDPQPAAACTLLRVDGFGAHGLKIAGEAIDLVDGDGALLSHFPAIQTKTGKSAYRVAPRALYGFGVSRAGGSTPCASNAGMQGASIP